MRQFPELELERIKQYLNTTLPGGGLEQVADEPDFIEKIAPHIDKRAKSKKLAEQARQGIKDLAKNQEVPIETVFALEAIILPDVRPVIDVEYDSFQTPEGIWSHLGEGSSRSFIEKTIPSVGRIELIDYHGVPYVGTGFVVGNDMIMTNRHVAESFTSGLGRKGLYFKAGMRSRIDFREEIVDSRSIEYDVIEPVMIHPHWDMAILRVAPLNYATPPLKLSVRHPLDLGSIEVAVIGFPAFDSRNNTEVQNQVFRGIYNVKRLQPGKLNGTQPVRSFNNFVDAFKHDASTLGGNSGSAVIDLITGEVVALHFAGIYKKSNYAVPTYELARDPHVQSLGLSFVGGISGDEPLWLSAWRSVDTKEFPPPSSAPSTASHSSVTTSPDIHQGVTVSDNGTVTWTIPLHVSVGIGGISGSTPQPSPALLSPATAPPAPDDAPSATGMIEAPPTRPDDNYSTRKGYDKGFLNGHEVDIPWLTHEQYSQCAFNGQSLDHRHVLPYHHFSIVMNRVRRLAFFSAVNIDGGTLEWIPRERFKDTWVTDPRIDVGAQMDNEFYRKHRGTDNPLDRGHLVRRLDPCWGDTPAEIIAAHHDTFHYTNAAPQHSGFNRSSYIWLGVEDYVLKKAIAHDLRVSVFSGPVISDNDPIYFAPTGVELQVPLQYWKVVAMAREDGSLSATGYLLSQEKKVDHMIEFTYGKYRSYQKPISEIERLTGLSFRGLDEHDPLRGIESAVSEGELQKLESIRF